MILLCAPPWNTKSAWGWPNKTAFLYTCLGVRSLAQDLDSDDLRPSVPTAIFSDGEIHQGEDVKLPINAFFDDFVLVVTAPTPQELIPKCARVLQKAEKAFATKGMEVNDNRGKTEPLLEFYGTGSAKV